MPAKKKRLNHFRLSESFQGTPEGDADQFVLPEAHALLRFVTGQIMMQFGDNASPHYLEIQKKPNSIVSDLCAMVRTGSESPT